METCRGKELAIRECIGLQRGLEKIETPQGFACAACIDKAFERASKDSLTGLSSREAFIGKFDRFVREGVSFGLLFADVKNLGSTNQELGHTRGDELLKATAQHLTSELRHDDMVAQGRTSDEAVGRWGGDEFVALVDLTPRKNEQMSPEERLENIAERLVSGFADNDVVMTCNRDLGENFAVGLKLGFAVRQGTLEETIATADPKGPQTL
jgi:diguanylate cyclase (GGDEF)-like protein